MKERDFLIGFERQLKSLDLNYGITWKLNSNTIFYFINKAKDLIVDLLYSVFQKNQSVSDALKALVKTAQFVSPTDFLDQDGIIEIQYPSDYVYSLGERVKLKKINGGLDVSSDYIDVTEATIENLDSTLLNSLSPYRLHYKKARPVRVFSDNKIMLYTDKNYSIDTYKLTYLKKSKDIGVNLMDEYTDIPHANHNSVIDLAILYYAASGNSKEEEKDNNKK